MSTVSEVVSIDFNGGGNTPGTGYVNPPSISFTGGTPTLAAVATASLLGTGAIFNAALSGSGGLRCPQTALLAQGNNMQVYDYWDDLNITPGVDYPKPREGALYYNIKADPLLRSRWPSVPVWKSIFTLNGTVVNGTGFVESTGLGSDPSADIIFSVQSLIWPSNQQQGCPWDQAYVQLISIYGSDGNDAIVPNTGPAGFPASWWEFWENLFQSAPFINGGFVNVNQAGIFTQSGRVSGLAVLPPLSLQNMLTGVSDNGSGLPMSGQLLLTLNNQVNFLSAAAAQIDLTQAGALLAVFANTFKVPCVITSIVLIVSFQNTQSSAAPSVNNNALITLGDAAGNYRNIIGNIDPNTLNQQGVATCLYGSNQAKELFPDAGFPNIVIQPGDAVYISVNQPATAPILAQVTSVYVKGNIFP
jgi:hypothetical protein